MVRRVIVVTTVAAAGGRFLVGPRVRMHAVVVFLRVPGVRCRRSRAVAGMVGGLRVTRG